MRSKWSDVSKRHCGLLAGEVNYDRVFRAIMQVRWNASRSPLPF